MSLTVCRLVGPHLEHSNKNLKHIFFAFKIWVANCNKWLNLNKVLKKIKKYLQWIKCIGIIEKEEEKDKGSEKTKMTKTIARLRERERERAIV